MKIELYYDKECPFCKYYANYIKLKEKNGLTLIDVREDIKSITTLKNKGFDINDGFIIQVDDTEFYQGSEAILYLNKIATKKIYFKDNIFFKHILYPFVKYLRKFVLMLLNKSSKL